MELLKKNSSPNCEFHGRTDFWHKSIPGACCLIRDALHETKLLTNDHCSSWGGFQGSGNEDSRQLAGLTYGMEFQGSAIRRYRYRYISGRKLLGD